MSDNEKTVKSKISMDLKSLKKSGGGSESDTKPLLVSNENSVNQEKPKQGTEANAEYKPVIQDAPKGASGYSSAPGVEASKSTSMIGKGYSMPVMMSIIALALGLVVILATAVRYESVGHYYYVESAVQLPSEIESMTTMITLGSCIRDFTKQATPEELTKLVQDEYSYTKGENDLVQTLVSTGCDTSISSPPMIHHGSILKAMF